MLSLYLSPAWLREAAQRLRADPLFRKLTFGLEGKILSEIRKAPAGTPQYLIHEFKGGALVRLEAIEEPVPADLSIVADYDTLVKLQKGQLNLRQAYFQGLVRLVGDAQKAMRFAPAFFKYQEILSTVETVY